MGPAERPDVIVDFSGLADGTVVRMINTGPDAPFGGFPDVPADPGTTGQVMQFVVNAATEQPGWRSQHPGAGSGSWIPTPVVCPSWVHPAVTQDLALLEEESALLCVTIDAVTGVIDLDPDSVPPVCDPVLGSVPFGPKAAVLGVNGSGGGTVQLWDDPIAQNPALGAIETWELWNWSADAHPIHLHLVKFEVVNRQIIGGAVRAARALGIRLEGYGDRVSRRDHPRQGAVRHPRPVRLALPHPVPRGQRDDGAVLCRYARCRLPG